MGSCTVNLPAPERYAVHKLIIHGERPDAELAKARKDLLQVAGLVEYFSTMGQPKTFNDAWRDALSRGPGWRKRALEGKKALLQLSPELDKQSLWKEKGSVK